jgi:hypothetical protein
VGDLKAVSALNNDREEYAQDLRRIADLVESADVPPLAMGLVVVSGGNRYTELMRVSDRTPVISLIGALEQLKGTLVAELNAFENGSE